MLIPKRISFRRKIELINIERRMKELEKEAKVTEYRNLLERKKILLELLKQKQQNLSRWFTLIIF